MAAIDFEAFGGNIDFGAVDSFVDFDTASSASIGFGVFDNGIGFGVANNSVDFEETSSFGKYSVLWNEVKAKPFESVDHNTLTVKNNVLVVNTTDNAEQDNTKPITSSGVHVIVGNIDTLLRKI